MPKIIENLENRLLEETQKQLRDLGYGAMTIRSVARGCGVGVGTVYNYFPSKEALVAAYLLTDWKDCVAAVEAVSAETDSPEPVARCIYDQLVTYAKRHQSVFRDEAALSGFSGSFGPYHAMLRSQLAAPVEKFCPTKFAAEFIAEGLLTWAMAGKSFDEIYGMIGKLFKE